MAKLYFHYSSMNAGKSTALLQANHNYIERGMKVFLTAKLDNRERRGHNKFAELELKKDARAFDEEDNLFDIIRLENVESELSCIFVDEAQFLKREQVKQLTSIVDDLNIPVLSYGIRTDFQGEVFEGSQYLMAWADEIKRN